MGLARRLWDSLPTDEPEDYRLAEDIYEEEWPSEQELADDEREE
jgi:hypothetical protein